MYGHIHRSIPEVLLFRDGSKEWPGVAMVAPKWGSGHLTGHSKWFGLMFATNEIRMIPDPPKFCPGHPTGHSIWHGSEPPLTSARIVAVCTDWQACTTQKPCSETCVRNYMNHYGTYCTYQAPPTCRDYARIHHGGPNGCRTNEDTNRERILQTFWGNVSACCRTKGGSC